jgi:hypothetical protein
VGIDDYPNFRSLAGAKNDAAAFEEWVLDSTQGGGVPTENCHTVLSEPDPVRPIQDDIDEKLEEIQAAIKNKGPTEVRRFYLYFSGHGLSSNRLGMDLCLGKWSRNRRRQALDANDYHKVVAGWGKFSEIILLYDCCRVRMSNAHGRECGLGSPRPDDVTGSDRYFIGYATEFQNLAMEAEVGGIDPSSGQESLVRGHFTSALLAALWGGAARDEGGVPASRLKGYLETVTIEIAERNGHKQKPEVLNGFPKDNEPVFGTAVPASYNVEIRFSPQRTGEMVLVGPDNQEIRRAPATGGPWRLQLSTGLHIIEDTVSGDIQPIRYEKLAGVRNVEF